MTLTLVSTKIVPVTLDLAKRFRDMQHIKGDRDLEMSRAKGHVKLIDDGTFFTPLWGQCTYEGVIYRGNGNHTSNVLTACMQAYLDSGLDDKAQQFCDDFLFRRGEGGWHGHSAQDLPRVTEKQFKACVEEYLADTREDLTTFFRRYDTEASARKAKHLLRVWVAEHDDLDGLDVPSIGRALAGILRAASDDPEPFGFIDVDVPKQKGDGRSKALKQEKVRACARWMVQSVGSKGLYAKPAAAQVFAELWAEHGDEQASAICDRVTDQLDDDDSPASAWLAILTKKHRNPAADYVVKRGRQVLGPIVEALLVSA